MGKGNQSLLSKELLINLVLSRQGLFASVGAAPMAGSHHNIFRSARTSCTTFGWFVRPVCKKNLDHLYTGMYALNHEKTHQTNPMAPWDPLDALLTP